MPTPPLIFMAVLLLVLLSAAAVPAAPPPPPLPFATTAQPFSAPTAALLPGFRRSPYFREQIREEWTESGIRVLLNAPAAFDPAKPTRLIVYATPNGNTIEQTLGSSIAPGTDWHFDIQHIAAQTRFLREAAPEENIVLAVTEAEGLSWPAWRQKQGTGSSSALIRLLVEHLSDEIRAALIPKGTLHVALTGHSGGGSFLFGFLNAVDTIPDYVDRIAFLDANYSYSDNDHHGDKLLQWLHSSPARHLAVIAYDDREIMLAGKKVVGPDGGTFRATERMRARFRPDTPITERKAGEVITSTALTGQVRFYVHTNPQNRILHTALVGEMNGFLEAMTFPASLPPPATFGGPRAYAAWVQPAVGIPPRPADAIGGAAFMAQIASLSPAAREEAIAAEICRGNLPPFLRLFKTLTVHATGRLDRSEHTATYEVMSDYLAVGSDQDFVRVPMTPQTAEQIAMAFGCTLPTQKIVDDVYTAAEVKLAPIPLTEAREAVSTFVQHQSLIEAQGAGKPLGTLTAGIKKDVVITPRLLEKPGRVAIYGWHQLSGQPIQPLTIVHRDTYVDYSHGIRLVKRSVLVDGKSQDSRAILHDPVLCPLLSNEGPFAHPTY